MDLNYLYQRHQISIYMAEHATSEPARRVHGELAAGYAARIAGAKCPRPPLRVG
jgi:hypothetical protein